MEINFKIILMVILGITVIVIFFIVAIQVQGDVMQRTNNWCNENYGAGNWYFKDITGTKEADKIAGRFYLGQVWECYEQ